MKSVRSYRVYYPDLVMNFSTSARQTGRHVISHSEFAFGLEDKLELIADFTLALE